MGSRPVRAARGTLASGIAIFVAALFHVAGGGDMPGAVPLALSLAFATLPAIALTTRRLSLWRLTVSVALSQLLFHVLFSMGDGSVRIVSSGTTAAPGHQHANSPLTMTEAAMPAVHTDHTAPSMWLTHAIAALITVAALRFGERAFWSLLTTAQVGVLRFSRLIAGFSPVPVRVVAVVTAVSVAEPELPRDLGRPFARLRHRGPPDLPCAF